jgi:hypothetical protein
MTDYESDRWTPSGWPTIDDPLPEPEHVEAWARGLGLRTMASRFLVPPREVAARRGDSPEEALCRHFGEPLEPIPNQAEYAPIRYVGRGWWILYNRRDDGVAYASWMLVSADESFDETWAYVEWRSIADECEGSYSRADGIDQFGECPECASEGRPYHPAWVRLPGGCVLEVCRWHRDKWSMLWARGGRERQDIGLDDLDLWEHDLAVAPGLPRLDPDRILGAATEEEFEEWVRIGEERLRERWVSSRALGLDN